MNITQKLKKKKFETEGIPEDWEVNIFSEAINVNPKRELKKGTETKFVSMGDLKEFDKRIHGHIIKKFSGGSKFINGDTLMARITPCLENGKTAFVDILNDEEIGSGSTEFIVLSAKNDKTIPHFVYYAAISPEIRKKAIISMTGTSGRQRVENDIFDKITLPIPPIPEQKAIVDILKSLDDKIALNRSMNSTLEAIGQALFKHWFVDFEFPNEEGKPYRLSGREMVKTELGEVPKGWEVGSILDCADLLSGGTPKTEIPEYWGGDIFWVSAKDVTDAHGSFVVDTERKITQAGIDNSNAKLLPKNTTIVTARGTVGSYCILSREMAINQTNYGLKAKSGIGDFFIFFSISNLVNQMKQNAYGTIFDTITTKTFKEMKVAIPPEAIIKSFDDKVNSVANKMLSNLQESRTFAALRDALLPKLMSGEIRVKVK